MQKTFSLFAYIAIVFFFGGCNSLSGIKDQFTKARPYEKYVRSLEKAELDETVMAKAWLRAGEKSLNDSVSVMLPFSESGYFNASEPVARSYRFEASEGQVLTANGAIISRDKTQFFLDLFIWENNNWKPVAHSDSTFNLTYEF